VKEAISAFLIFTKASLDSRKLISCHSYFLNRIREAKNTAIFRGDNQLSGFLVVSSPFHSLELSGETAFQRRCHCRFGPPPYFLIEETSESQQRINNSLRKKGSLHPFILALNIQYFKNDGKKKHPGFCKKKKKCDSFSRLLLMWVAFFPKVQN